MQAGAVNVFPAPSHSPHLPSLHLRNVFSPLHVSPCATLLLSYLHSTPTARETRPRRSIGNGKACAVHVPTTLTTRARVLLHCCTSVIDCSYKLVTNQCHHQNQNNTIHTARPGPAAAHIILFSVPRLGVSGDVQGS